MLILSSKQSFTQDISLFLKNRFSMMAEFRKLKIIGEWGSRGVQIFEFVRLSLTDKL